ncbi:MAG: GTP cyclohydrolase II [Fimbriimonadaceae bacterium]|nr:MAG: GTP cyclohydrolase II [Fimbriimonadaceae bacterium]
MSIAAIPDALAELKAGKMVIVVDDPSRENEGDLIMLGEHVKPDDMNFMIKEGRGVPFISTTPERLEKLGVPMMTKANTARLGTAMAETADAVHGTTTGVSAGDRAKTVAVFCDEAALPSDLMRPGHMLVLRAEKGGVLRRAGHTEASVDLARLCDSQPVAVGVEIVGDDGEMLRMGGGLESYAEKHGLLIITIEDLIAYRRRMEKLIRRSAGPINFPTKYGQFTLYAYETEVEPEPFLAIVKGEITAEPTLVRVHSSCLTGDILGSLRCDCGDQLSAALQMIDEAGSGVVLYIAQEGRGIGIINKLRAYELQEQGLDTVEANEALGFKPDQRDYGLGSQVLYDLGVRKMRLISNNPAKRAGLQGFGLEIVETVPIVTPTTEHSEKYIQTKKDKMGHLIP